MKPRFKLRFNLATVMCFVVTAAAGSALFAKVRQFTPDAGKAYLKIDTPILFVLSIVLTAIALGALKGHTARQVMLQFTIACVGYLSLLELAEWHVQRPLLYWFQLSFGVLVTGPLVARDAVKRNMERGPRRTWWKNTWEAVFFSFLTMMLVLVGLLLQWITYMMIPEIMKL